MLFRSTLTDVACFVPALRKFEDELLVDCQFSGTSTSARIPELHFKTRSGSVVLDAKGKLADWDRTLRWHTDIKTLKLSADGIKQVAANLGKRINIPQEVLRLGNIYYIGEAGGAGKKLGTKGYLRTDAGEVNLKAEKNGEQLAAHIDTKGINLGRILDNKKFGILAATLDAHGTTKHLAARGSIPRFDFNNYSFRNIQLDGSYNNGLIDGLASIADPNINLQVKGNYSIPSKQYAVNADIRHLQPSILGVKMADKTYSLDDIQIEAHRRDRKSVV